MSVYVLYFLLPAICFIEVLRRKSIQHGGLKSYLEYKWISLIKYFNSTKTCCRCCRIKQTLRDGEVARIDVITSNPSISTLPSSGLVYPADLVWLQMEPPVYEEACKCEPPPPAVKLDGILHVSFSSSVRKMNEDLPSYTTATGHHDHQSNIS